MERVSTRPCHCGDPRMRASGTLLRKSLVWRWWGRSQQTRLFLACRACLYCRWLPPLPQQEQALSQAALESWPPSLARRHTQEPEQEQGQQEQQEQQEQGQQRLEGTGKQKQQQTNKQKKKNSFSFLLFACQEEEEEDDDEEEENFFVLLLFCCVFVWVCELWMIFNVGANFLRLRHDLTRSSINLRVLI